MIKYISLNYLKIFLFLLISLYLFFGIKNALAQEVSEETTQKYNVTFPIAELDGCKDYSSCRNFCEDPVNSTKCTNYAKSKGFYKEEEFEVKNDVLEKAKSDLGCDSSASCQNFCEVPANYDKCDSFAKRRGLAGGVVSNPEEKKIVEKAKEVLGCSSPKECSNFCQKDENRDKCSNFAKDVGLRGGERPVGPGGCTSESTCKAFCSSPENYQVCSGFVSTNGGNFTGPGGCNSEASCKSYCEKNPNDCGYGSGKERNEQGKYDPVEMCNRTPNCAWSGNYCQCGLYGETRESQNRAKEYAEYCQSNSDKCKVGPGGYPIPEEKLKQLTTPQGDYQNYGDYCKENPERCNPNTSPSSTFDNPAAVCARYNCVWSGNSCQCANINTSPSTTNWLEDHAKGCANSGGTWRGTYCEKSQSNKADTNTTGGSGRGSTGTNNNSPSSYEKGCNPGHYWDGSKCTAGSYEGPGWSDSAAREGKWCQPPSNGCGADYFWDYTYCSCNRKSDSGNNGSSSGGSSGGSYSPAEACTRTTGCNWTGSSCQCSGYTGGAGTNYTPPPTNNTAPQNDDPATACARGGCNWTGSSCQCTTQPQQQTVQPQPVSESQPVQQTQPQPQPESQPAPQPDSQPASQSDTTTQTVQGISVVRNLLQQLFDFLGR